MFMVVALVFTNCRYLSMNVFNLNLDFLLEARKLLSMKLETITSEDLPEEVIGSNFQNI